MSKFKNYAFLASLLSAVVLFINGLLKVFGITFDTGEYVKLAEALLMILAILGVVTAPPDKLNIATVIDKIKSVKLQPIVEVVSEAEKIAPKVESIVDTAAPIIEAVVPETKPIVEKVKNTVDTVTQNIQ